ncbi:uncharacterized protein TOT_040000096 [Theileria orientalis strain Shintoku]|uniref:K Homology domain-containing protein n=1 Tax=Theileria orientalis strain Shintoku TaxID=869250 RepID=J4DA11_THEOR|nr:uncharacterized protein TOT_040000096 [Theileria orientalis strain Shintoku]BAM41715.1 uncharacterized protein TOT_040000096 [Theileria orientalis strain Shintoku]|eukprot:XP_009692016.1 uncharacterized protein TOT_040000096 [Theileria orientalis strain Shintoku]
MENCACSIYSDHKEPALPLNDKVGIPKIMITSEDNNKGVVYGVNMSQSQSKHDYLARLTMDMTSLEISSAHTDNPMSQTFTESKSFGSSEYNWMSGLVESRGSCETSNTYMYDSINTQLSQDKLGYAYEPSISTEQINPDELGLANVSLPLLDYYPTYNVEAEKISQVTLPHTPQDSVQSNTLSQNYRLRNSQYNASVSSTDTISPLQMSFIKSYRKNLYQAKDSFVFLKILATQLVSGTIIGRGGKGLNWFRRKSKVEDIVLSMPWELYPKTEYRTLLLKGSLKAVIKSTCIIAELMNSRYSLLSDNTMMVMVVLPDLFLTALDEIKKSTNPNLLSITLFRDENSQHQEIVAVLKGDKSKVKDLVAAVATSVTETVSPEKYCFVSYPNSDEYQYHMQMSDSGSETLKRHSSTRAQYSNYALKNHSREIDTLVQQIENSVEKANGNLVTLSKISTLVKHKPDLMSKNVEVHITLKGPIPEEAFTVITSYKCELTQSEQENGTVNCKVAGQFAGCFATLLYIFTVTDQSNHV